jgi:hypothetical protein
MCRGDSDGTVRPPSYKVLLVCRNIDALTAQAGAR